MQDTKPVSVDAEPVSKICEPIQTIILGAATCSGVKGVMGTCFEAYSLA